MAEEKNAQTVDAEVAEPAAPIAKQRSGLLPVLIIGVVLICASAAVTLFAVRWTLGASAAGGVEKSGNGEKSGHGEKSGGHGGKPEKGGAPSGLVNLDIKDVFVNIAETKGMRVLKVKLTLVATEPKLKEYLEGNESLVRDRISQAVARLTLDDLDGARGRDNLKREIMTLINEAVKDRAEGGISDVYFADLLIQ